MPFPWSLIKRALEEHLRRRPTTPKPAPQPPAPEPPVVVHDPAPPPPTPPVVIPKPAPVVEVDPPAPAAPTILRTYRLKDDQYVKEVQPKDTIFLHHTVGGSIMSSFGYWQSTADRVGTAYGIERDGGIYEVFDPQHWAWHLGAGAHGAGNINEKRSIGIELGSEGPLIPVPNGTGATTIFWNPKTGRYLPATDRIVDLGFDWRTFTVRGTTYKGRFFDEYNPAQVDSCIALVRHLLDKFPTIPRQCPADPTTFDASWRGFKGVLSHSHVRSDKTDIHPKFPWDRLIEECGLTPVSRP